MASPRRTFAVLVAVLTMAGLVAAGCGSKSSSSSSSAAASSAATQSGTTSTSSTKFAKTKLVLHAGLAFGAVHRWIYKPFKAGSFTGGNLTKNKAAVVKAGLAGLFAYHELKLAGTDAKSIPILAKPIAALQTKLHSLGTSLKGGKVDPSAIESSNTDITSLKSAASAAGYPISESVPSAAQLASGATGA